LLNQGILDSMSFLEFIVDIESAFNIELDFSELDPSEFTSIDNIVKLIENGN
jgi:acyl carrier protein